MSNLPQFNPDLTILEQIEQDPDATQATLASHMNVAVGTINWHLKRLIEKGYVKAHRLERKKLRYIITPEGIALRARLTVDYIQSSFNLYRTVRVRVLAALDQVKQAGFHTVRIVGEGDVAEICRLTCLEQGVAIVEDTDAPALVIRYLKVFVEWKEN
ncbi:MAG: winged helix-turn-helix domain-containing protein [Anaerolineaceae bacterium]|jgi:DNA-binding MarR family transcriptional regulator